SGDIATPIKKANTVIQLEFEKLEEAADQQLINSAPDLLRPMLEKAFGCPSEYEKSLVKACDIYSAYIKCVMEVAAGNSIEFYDAHKDLSQRLEVVKKVHPEIATVDEWFTEGFGLSL